MKYLFVVVFAFLGSITYAQDLRVPVIDSLVRNEVDYLTSLFKLSEPKRDSIRVALLEFHTGLRSVSKESDPEERNSELSSVGEKKNQVFKKVLTATEWDIYQNELEEHKRNRAEKVASQKKLQFGRN